MVQSAYGRPPVLDRLITIEGEPVWAARRDLSARDVVDSNQTFEQVSLSYSRFIVRAGIVLTLGNDFVDDSGNNRRIEGVSEVGRGQFIEILGRTSALTPVDPVEPVEPVVPSTTYRFATKTRFTPNSDGVWNVFINTVQDTARFRLYDTDSDGVMLATASVGNSVTFTWGSYSVTGELTDVGIYTGGFGGQQVLGVEWTIAEVVDESQATGELEIII